MRCISSAIASASASSEPFPAKLGGAVAALHDAINALQVLGPVERHHVAHAGGDLLAAVREFLVGLFGIEAPHAGAAIQQRTRLEAHRLLILGHIGIGADIARARHHHIEAALAVEGDTDIAAAGRGQIAQR